ncbi:hypothetical protein MK489_00580 [Myxococcota bacterium]|nr:hypothetical protein [Myxococcota bacterium]
MSPTEPGPLRATIGLSVAVIALALVVYLPTVGHDWVNYDDPIYVYDNPRVAEGLTLEGTIWAFSSFFGANWFPLTWLSWMLDNQWFGMNPGAFHTTNALLHALSAWLLFAALTRMTGDLGRSAFVAALFAVHPLHVESVAWISARKDTLSGVFFMLALWVYAGRPIDSDRLGVGRRLALLGCTAAALMSKPTAATLPFVLLLLDAWPLGRLTASASTRRLDLNRLRRSALEKVDLFALVIIASFVFLAAQHSADMVVGLNHLGFGARLSNAAVSCVSYLGKFAWPTNLAVLYPHPGNAQELWKPLIAGTALLIATIGAAMAWLRRPAFTVGWLWFLGTLLPTIGLLQVGSQAMADRYMYLPLIGLSLAMAWGVFPPASDRTPAVRMGLATMALASIASLTAVAGAQVGYWRNSELLFRHTVTVTTDNHIAHAHLASALLERGDAESAIDHFTVSIRLRPDAPDVSNHFAWLLATHGDRQIRNPYLAIKLAERASRLSQRGQPAYLDTLAAAYASAERYEEAVLTAREGADLARELGQEALAQAMETRLALYQDSLPYIHTPWGNRR